MADSSPPDLVDVVTWSRAIISAAIDDHGGPLPEYGSPEWARLPAPQRWASALIAAECWRFDSDPEWIRIRLLNEYHARQAAEKRLDDAEYVANRDAHRARWSYLAKSPAPFAGQQVPPRTFEEIGAETRERVAAAARTRRTNSEEPAA